MVNAPWFAAIIIIVGLQSFSVDQPFPTDRLALGIFLIILGDLFLNPFLLNLHLLPDIRLQLFLQLGQLLPVQGHQPIIVVCVHASLVVDLVLLELLPGLPKRAHRRRLFFQIQQIICRLLFHRGSLCSRICVLIQYHWRC